ncbi:class I SAM-dependent methyltransferase [Sphingomonas antarctica]|uniref:class I SAM-dependent methyltransferase n=1 Tax=Sphingomonas antarctica TaxID=2040274 RepID=UPI0039E89852
MAERLARAIALAGPIPISQFMAAANTEYYGSGVPLGRDFVTASEISQMFGEIVGAWTADLRFRAGNPDALWVELGPGRGTLTADALRVIASTGWQPEVHFVETSRSLRAEQARRVAVAQWHDDVTTLPDDRPLILVANEFFDALPIRQLIRTIDGWHERLIACQDTLFLPVTGKAVPEAVIPSAHRDAPPGSILEISPAAVGVMKQLAARVHAQGGALLIVDYGYTGGPQPGESLQAVRHHQYASPFDAPGSVDLSAHVDFTTLAAAGIASGLAAHGPVAQRDFLGSLGLDARAAALAKADPDVMAARHRLMGEDAMGTLFKVLALTAPNWPEPAGFL